MSGGVDSSVAAYLLKAQGYDVHGVYLKCYVRPDKSCMKEAMDAKVVAEKLGFPFEIWDFEKEYKKRVIDYMIDGYRKGLTPNPDILCNREIKFGLFLEEALRQGADYVATGHYVKIVENDLSEVGGGALDGNKASIKHPKFYSLFAARDASKDQSYFLWTLTQHQLKYVLFPVGNYLKSEVRDIARKAGLPTAEKKDSQGVCFLGPIRLEDFLASYIKPKVGRVRLFSGGKFEEIGEHKGAHIYTIGQRRGVGNLKHERGMMVHEPLYVVAKDVKKNIITVARRGEAEAVESVGLEDVNFVNPRYFYTLKDKEGGVEILTRVRYRQLLVGARITQNKEGVRLFFSSPQRFVASGQSAVFYTNGGELVGGGVIV